MKRNKFSGLLYLIVVFLLFTTIFSRFVYLAFTPTYNGVDLQERQDAISIQTTELNSLRGNIYDSSGSILAQSVYSYRIVATLDPSKTTNPNILHHVADPVGTANALCGVLACDPNSIIEYLSQTDVDITYLGETGNNVTATQKSAIDELHLPGIDFDELEKRSYPFGEFASYEIGYAKYDEETGDLIGELGVESSRNEFLTGTDGSSRYLIDAQGNPLFDANNVTVDAQNGCDITLTLNAEIQLYIENALTEAFGRYAPQEMGAIVADAKTGEILGSSSRPTFNPNNRDISSWVNPLVESSFEPGSVMKTFTFASAIDAGTYNGQALYQSGSRKIDGMWTVSDWNRVGWGSISLDEGYAKSSNTAVVELFENYLDAQVYQNYLHNFGFGKETGIDLSNETAGTIEMTSGSQVITSGFGQGITVSPYQMIQGMTAFGTNGDVMRPYIIDNITCNGEITYQGEPFVNHKNVISYETSMYMRKLMDDVINSSWGTGAAFRLEDYNLIGKTSTAQIAGSNGQYIEGNFNYGFTGLFPGNDPKYIIYVYAKLPSYNSGFASVSETVKKVILGIAHSQGFPTTTNAANAASTTIKTPNYFGQSTSVINYPTTILLNSGDIVIDQFPKPNQTLNSYQALYIVTNGPKTIPNFTNMSYNDTVIVANLLGLKLEYQGNITSTVVAQSVAPSTLIEGEMTVVIRFAD